MEFKKALKNNNCDLLIVQVLYIVQRYSDSPIKRLETVFYYHQPLGREIVSGKIKISILSCLLVLVEVVCAVANGFKNVCSDCIKLLLLQQRSKSQFMNYAAYAYEQLSRKSPMQCKYLATLPVPYQFLLL